MGGSHVTNVPQLEVEDLSSLKDRFRVYLDEIETFLLEWSPKNRKLANQDKRLKSIIISCLLNDRMKVVIKCATAREMWNNLIISHEGPSETRDTKIAALRLKFNAFKTLKGKKDSESDVEEDTRSNQEFLAQ
ncbi:hypothetical protein Tco_0716591 [Tanacetum coccineum]